MLPARLAQKMEGSAPHPPTAPKRLHVTIRGLTKQFGAGRIYDDLDLDLPRGELISVFGPNGCGKSTLINMIAGLVPADAGQILFDGRKLAAINFGYVFQNYREALFPWMRAFDNIAYALKLKNVPPAAHREACGASRHQARSGALSLSDVRRAAAACLDPARSWSSRKSFFSTS